MIDLFSFAAGFFLALVFSTLAIAIAFEIRKKRALAFTKRFAVISEGLSSLKALSFRLAGQLKRLRQQLPDSEITEQDTNKFKNYLDGLVYVFDNISAGMMPPTEEIAMEALRGRKTSSEQRAYDDGLKFRDNVRQIRQRLDKGGLEGLNQTSNQAQTPDGPKHNIFIVDK